MQAGAFLDVDLSTISSWTYVGPPLDSAKSLDVHIQLMLATSIRALENAKFEYDALRFKSLGVFTASQPSEFAVPIFSCHVARSIASGLRVSGPHHNYDAVCSSGYLAIHNAMHSLHSVQSSVGAVVAGASLYLSSLSAEAISLVMASWSPSGIMRPLDVKADGMVRGEASVALVLLPQSEQCSLLGSAANCNNALTPAGFADPAMIQRAAEQIMSNAAVGARMLIACHPHLMGNPSSDQPELAGLLKAFDDASRGTAMVLVGHKANFGHSISVAGLMSVITTSVVLEHGVVPVHLRVSDVVARLKQATMMSLPVELATVLECSIDGERLGAISGTSASGDNVHLVMQHAGGMKYVNSLLDESLDRTQTEDDGATSSELGAGPPPEDGTVGAEPKRAANLPSSGHEQHSSIEGSMALWKSLLHDQQMLLTACTSAEERQSKMDEIRGMELRIHEAYDRLVRPILSKPGYRTVPPIELLQAMKPDQLSCVVGFQVIRAGFGQIEWDCPVDLRGACLDRDVIIGYGTVDVYPEAQDQGAPHPSRGSLLNKPATVTLIISRSLVDQMQADIEAAGDIFLGYDPHLGELKFQILHSPSPASWNKMAGDAEKKQQVQSASIDAIGWTAEAIAAKETEAKKMQQMLSDGRIMPQMLEGGVGSFPNNPQQESSILEISRAFQVQPDEDLRDPGQVRSVNR